MRCCYSGPFAISYRGNRYLQLSFFITLNSLLLISDGISIFIVVRSFKTFIFTVLANVSLILFFIGAHMFFILSKVLFYLVMPLTWILVFVGVSIWAKKERIKKRTGILALALLLLFTNPFLSNEAWLAWEVPPTPMATLPLYDAAIVLTGISNQEKSPHDRVYIERGADRILLPLRLYKEGRVKKIIISGGSGAIAGSYTPEAMELRQILLYAGVSAPDILVESSSRNTHENALFTKALLKQHPELNKLLLVTSAFHMRRAAACFKKQGIAADTFSTDFYTKDRSLMPDDAIIPQEKYLHYWQKLFHEVLGYLMYKLIGYC